MTWNEMVEVSRIQDVIGLLGDKGLVKTRPFRHPHHTATLASMVGGGIQGRPGEVTLAHGGVLFMDEAPEFQRQVIDALRQPLEDVYKRQFLQALKIHMHCVVKQLVF